MRARTRATGWPGLLAACVVCVAGCGDESADLPPLEALAKDFAPACPSTLAGGSPFVAAVVSVALGEGGGHGADELPEVVMGPPQGRGQTSGSLDVLSLGRGGEVVVRLGADVVDCSGPDLLVFENAFAFAGQTFYELAEVSVSPDGRRWETFSCDPAGDYPFVGCAGVATVASSDANGVDPLDPVLAGGDAFDLADLGVERIRFVRIRDLDATNGPSGPTARGFDLDAVAIAHGSAESFDSVPR